MGPPDLNSAAADSDFVTRGLDAVVSSSEHVSVQSRGQFSIGTVIAPRDDNSAILEGKVRVLGISRDCRSVSLIRVDVPTPLFPYIRDVETLRTCLEQGDLQEAAFDAVLAASENQLTGRARQAMESNFNAIAPLLNDEERLLFDPEFRRQRIKESAAELGLSERTIQRALCMYWFAGCTKLGLAGPIKPKRRRKQARHTARRGRKPSRHAPSMPGWAIREKTLNGIKEFIVEGHLDRRTAYTETLNKYFSYGKKGVWLPLEKRPSMRQFRSLVDEQRDLGSIPRRRHGKKALRDTTRVMHSVIEDVRGPGDRFEVDATRLQVRIVSTLDRSEIVKEATLYILSDVWACGTIVGYAISLGPACLEVAREALLNCFTDKAAVFKRVGIDRPDSRWLICKHLPRSCGVDRGELISNNAGVIPEVGVMLEVMPPYRPDLKGEVEQIFNQVKHGKKIRGIPGIHKKAPSRGEDTGKRTASLTLPELERIIVFIILHLNAQPVPVGRIPFEALRGRRKHFSRIELYEWGLHHCPGFTRVLPAKEVLIALLAKGTASMTAKGLHFRNQDYYSPKLEELGYVERAEASTQGYEVEICYPRNEAEQIWFLDSASGEWYPAVNTNPEVARLRCSHRELTEFRRRAEEVALNTTRLSVAADHEIDQEIKSTLTNARKLTRAAMTGKSRTDHHVIEMTHLDRQAERFGKADEELKQFTPEDQDLPLDYGDELPDEDSANAQSLNASARAVWHRPRRRKYA